LLCFSAHWEPIDFTVPGDEYGTAWQVVVDTADPDVEDRVLETGQTVSIDARSLVVLQRTA
jgi:glycogen operon protein